ncbi:MULTISPECIES: DUF4169 family protein [unclassified Paracoccus (in: a-proteobacteria)]|uniref:DUF4169 family protein n=1 Tax=unclassified Paracoccus (in: a-proteobacteria) TaxID=2688777 RepID=UPI001601F281|nr:MULTISPECIES: DUF4169 family protein [unclassified Paracoccus (in: a-proteobacteria)]MBB1490053.1 DUF4169 family protein [Paracoccus sp. MC1854]MBB1496641.1 DUF4169 family protein [Paracoccus sp. MC1862]QQO43657.1 DUF4169 family protein [Paracoccus sp. MC1862]
MTQIINLSRARKDKARADKRRQGDANAARHGRTKAERLRDEAEAERAALSLDRHRRDDD